MRVFVVLIPLNQGMPYTQTIFVRLLTAMYLFQLIFFATIDAKSLGS